MRSAGHVGGLIAFLFVASMVRGDDANPADNLTRLKEEFAAYRQEDTLARKLSSSLKPGATEADRDEVIRRHIKQDIARQAAFARRLSTWPGPTRGPPRRSRRWPGSSTT